MLIYRELAARDPDAFRRDLARVLGARSQTLAGLGRWPECRDLLGQALMTALVRDYLKASEEAGVMPDASMLEPIVTLLVAPQVRAEEPET